MFSVSSKGGPHYSHNPNSWNTISKLRCGRSLSGITEKDSRAGWKFSRRSEGFPLTTQIGGVFRMELGTLRTCIVNTWTQCIKGKWRTNHLPNPRIGHFPPHLWKSMWPPHNPQDLSGSKSFSISETLNVYDGKLFNTGSTTYKLH